MSDVATDRRRERYASHYATCISYNHPTSLKDVEETNSFWVTCIHYIIYNNTVNVPRSTCSQ